MATRSGVVTDVLALQGARLSAASVDVAFGGIVVRSVARSYSVGASAGRPRIEAAAARSVSDLLGSGAGVQILDV